MIKLEVKLKTNEKNEIPIIMKEIAEKIVDGIDMSNAEKYSFKIKE